MKLFQQLSQKTDNIIKDGQHTFDISKTRRALLMIKQTLQSSQLNSALYFIIFHLNLENLKHHRKLYRKLQRKLYRKLHWTVGNFIGSQETLQETSQDMKLYYIGNFFSELSSHHHHQRYLQDRERLTRGQYVLLLQTNQKYVFSWMAND